MLLPSLALEIVKLLATRQELVSSALHVGLCLLDQACSVGSSEWIVVLQQLLLARSHDRMHHLLVLGAWCTNLHDGSCIAVSKSHIKLLSEELRETYYR